MHESFKAGGFLPPFSITSNHSYTPAPDKVNNSLGNATSAGSWRLVSSCCHELVQTAASDSSVSVQYQSEFMWLGGVCVLLGGPPRAGHSTFSFSFLWQLNHPAKIFTCHRLKAAVCPLEEDKAHLSQALFIYNAKHPSVTHSSRQPRLWGIHREIPLTTPQTSSQPYFSCNLTSSCWQGKKGFPEFVFVSE